MIIGNREYPNYFTVEEKNATTLPLRDRAGKILREGKPIVVKVLKDFTGSTWGVFLTYKKLKQSVPILVWKYESVLKSRGVFPSYDEENNENV